MAEAVRSFILINPPHGTTRLFDSNPSPRTLEVSRFPGPCHGRQEVKSRGRHSGKLRALPLLTDLHWPPLMAVLVEHAEGQREFISNKSIWHLSDDALKSVYTFYIMFTCWGCLFFGAMKDPYYDSETYRKDGGDGTGNWLYERQDDIEESARAELWREELIEEIEQKVGGLRELEEAGRK
ncbi:photosynthetic NDH subunit of subcomplex B 4, chloroplastic isoform X1 [Punica granatum]|uniref:Photosynthetic NDH subunit of subcomplex B 4, chloroplastic isoform X1 n=1 Tax=Punica granatum TaxID=22663 RepID=A0A6P8BP48_PUNGR|nr:photosynthetic NDH subunit of subcomplex B 4, chloroplastic isoform X1 [Punica granatum]